MSITKKNISIESLMIILLIITTTMYLDVGNWFHRNNFNQVIYFYFAIKLFHVLIIKKDKLIINREILIIIIITIISFFWSVDKINTLKTSIFYFAFPSFIMMYIANKYSFFNLMKITNTAGLIMIIFSYLFVLLLPVMGIEHGGHSGAWKGIFATKNNLALAMTFFLIPTTYLLLQSSKKKTNLYYLLALFLEMILLIKSTSTTGLLVALIILFSFFLVKINSFVTNKMLKQSIFWFGFSVLLLPIIFIVIKFTELLNLFGKDITFTGRTPIWEACLLLIKERIFLGYGFDSVFIEGTYTKEFIDYYIRWNLIGGSHNGYLDILLGIGMIGLLLVIISLFHFIIRCFMILNTEHKFNSYTCLLYLLFLLIYNFQESAFLKGNYMIWNYYVYFHTYLMIATRKKNHMQE